MFVEVLRQRGTFGTPSVSLLYRGGDLNIVVEVLAIILFLPAWQLIQFRYSSFW